MSIVFKGTLLGIFSSGGAMNRATAIIAHDWAEEKKYLYTSSRLYYKNIGEYEPPKRNWIEFNRFSFNIKGIR